jgi:hypothetical protein
MKKLLTVLFTIMATSGGAGAAPPAQTDFEVALGRLDQPTHRRAPSNTPSAPSALERIQSLELAVDQLHMTTEILLYALQQDAEQSHASNISKLAAFTVLNRQIAKDKKRGVR